jgi:hypothetical protein
MRAKAYCYYHFDRVGVKVAAWPLQRRSEDRSIRLRGSEFQRRALCTKASEQCWAKREVSRLRICSGHPRSSLPAASNETRRLRRDAGCLETEQAHGRERAEMESGGTAMGDVPRFSETARDSLKQIARLLDLYPAEPPKVGAEQVNLIIDVPL